MTRNDDIADARADSLLRGREQTDAVADAIMAVGEATRRIARRLARAIPCPEHTELVDAVDRLLATVKDKVAGVTS